LAHPLPTLAERTRWNSRRRVTAALLGSALMLSGGVLALKAPALRPAPGRVWAVFLDVGQGDACALGFPDGAWWLVDAGPRSSVGDAGEGVVLPFLRWAGVRRLDAMVLTHDDADHVGGAAAVLRGMRVDAVWVPSPVPAVPGPGPGVARAGPRSAARGEVLRDAPAVEALWPPRADPPELRSDNRRGLVLRVADALVLAADIDTLVEDSIRIEAGVALLKIAHHGSGTSTSSDWLERQRPRWAVISCGRRNRFGHPSPRVLERLREHGVRVWRTDLDRA